MASNESTNRYKSVVQLSDECMRRLTLAIQGKSVEKNSDQQENKNLKMNNNKDQDDEVEEECNKPVLVCEDSDCDKMKKLHCIDEQHSVEKGITQEDFETLFNKVNSQAQITYKMPCSGSQLVKCLNNNPKCSIKCREYANMFIDCVDRERVIKMRKLMEEELRLERQRNEEELKRLLSKPTC